MAASSANYAEVASWRSLGKHVYRSVRLFSGGFRLGAGEIESLDDFVVCAAPCGGPIAVTKNMGRLTVLRASGAGAVDTITIFSSSGVRLGSTALQPHEGRLLGMAWTPAEQLACVFEDGSVDLYDPLATLQAKAFSLLPPGFSAPVPQSGSGRSGFVRHADGDRIESFAHCGSGMAAVIRRGDGSVAISAVYDWGDRDGAPVAVHLASVTADLLSDAASVGMGVGVAPTAIACLDGAFTADGRMEVLLATATRSIVVVDSEDRALDQQLQGVLPAVVRMIALSPSGRYLAAFGEDGSVTVTDTAFETKVLQFETHASAAPSQLVWCGDDSVAMTWPERGLLLVGPFGDYRRFIYGEGGLTLLGGAGSSSSAAGDADGDGSGGLDDAVLDDPDAEAEAAAPLHVVQEMDCLRVIGGTFHELLQMVPPPVQRIRAIGSTKPAATLATAAHKFESGEADCDELLRSLKRDGLLGEAVADCLAAAAGEWDIASQQALLRCASFGKAADPDADAAAFVASCRELRLLNALRSDEGGLPLTARQLKTLGYSTLVDRLAARHAYRLALQICEYVGSSLDRDRDRVLVHWASARVRSSASRGESDEALVARIRKNLAGVAGVSYADIAAAAHSAGRTRLATMLLALEPRLADQVPILLKMREGPLALERALQSGDPDLVMLALLHLRRQCAVTARLAGAGGGGGSSSHHAGDDASASAAGSGMSDGAGPGLEDFLRIIASFPAAADLLAAHYREKRADPALVARVFASCGRHADAGHALLAAAAPLAPSPYGRPRDSAAASAAGGPVDTHIRLLQRAAAAFREGERAPASSSADRSSCAFYRSTAEEQAQLLSLQVDMDAEAELDASRHRHDDGAPTRFLGLPLAETVSALLRSGDSRRAQMLRDAFKLPDPAWYHAKIGALAAARDWLALQRFADERKPPVGFRPFVDACMGAAAGAEARKYASRIPEFEERFKAFVDAGAIVDAAEAAAKAKDIARLQSLEALARTPAAREAVERGLEALGMR